MKRRVDLIDQFADLVFAGDDPRHLAERTIEVVMSLVNGRSGAVFTKDGERVALFASSAIDQHVLDAIQMIWSRFRESFEKSETFYVPDYENDRRLDKLPGSGLPPASMAVVPVLRGGAGRASLRGQLRPLLHRPRPGTDGEVLQDHRQGGDSGRRAGSRTSARSEG